MPHDHIRIAIVLSFSLALLLTAVLRPTLRRLRLLDWPDGIRKSHSTPVPRGGGVALFITLAVLLPLLGAFGTDPNSRGIAAGAAIVFAIGLIDDICGVSPGHKLAGEILAAVVACAGGLRIGSYYDGSVLWNVPLTVLWIAAATNAFNLIDGLDGLASGLGVIAASTVCFSAIQYGQWDVAAIAGSLAGALLGFLVYNSPPASIFLGDSGSLLIGFLLGVLAIKMKPPVPALTGYLGAPILLSVPLLDLGVSVARRFLCRQPLFCGDRCHVHHMLFNRGFSGMKPLLILYTCGAVAALISWLQCSGAVPLARLSLLAFIVGVLAAVRWLAYAEFRIAWRMLRGFRRELAAEMRVQAWQQVSRVVAASNGSPAVAQISVKGRFEYREVCRQVDADLRGCECHVRLPLLGSDAVVLKTASAPDLELTATLIHMLSSTLAQQSHDGAPGRSSVRGASARALRGRVLHHSFSKILFFVAAAVLMRTMKLALMVIRMRTLARVIEAARSRRPVRDNASCGERVAWAIDAAGCQMRTPGLCLIKALAAQTMLSFFGCAAELCIGVRRAERGNYTAHAWLMRNGEVLVGGPSSQMQDCIVLGTSNLRSVAQDA
jgi:UDP-GlcNAc:undecaprenyl-phosphate GlcNAc-1-phosphate transferase